MTTVVYAWVLQDNLLSLLQSHVSAQVLRNVHSVVRLRQRTSKTNEVATSLDDRFQQAS
jgi:hypothetical protein